MPPFAGLDWVGYAVCVANGVIIALEYERWATWVRAKLGPPNWRRDPIAELATAAILVFIAVFWPFTAPLRKILRAHEHHDTQRTNYDGDGP
jgi:hypothetical protein